MKYSLTSVQQKKNTPVKNTMLLLCALLIGAAAYFIYMSGSQKTLSGLSEGNAPLSLRAIDWNATFFSTESYAELKVLDLASDELGQLGNKNPFERLKKDE